MSPHARRRSVGFTLVELMIVMVVLSILASLGFTAFSRYTARSRTTEAVHNVGKIYQNQLMYYQHGQEFGPVASFCNAAATPAANPSASKYAANAATWTADPAWVALSFTLDAPHYYQYASPATVSAFTARAVGDIDGDGVRSSFERVGTVEANGEVQSGGLRITLELE